MCTNSGLLGLALCLVPFGLVRAQSEAAPRSGVEVRVVGAGALDGSYFVSYRVRNERSSSRQLWSFTVEAPGGPLQVEAPAPPCQWTVSTRFGTMPTARWVLRGALLAPGAETPELRFQAAGVPGIVPFYAGWYWDGPGEAPTERIRVSQEEDALSAHAVRGVTVGIVPIPPNTEPGALLERVRALRCRACALQWIDSLEMCTILEAKLGQAALLLEQDQDAAARDMLAAFLSELETRHVEPGMHINDSAYWLLRTNGEYLLGRMP